ncbi:MAG: hypothetical protein HN736_13455 [Anaerolineae bacterium]|nr:hypothetical protein [Anaerolineae bacterium]MBT3714273.1 hypothetical protein [Anaerolineae bacterium]MBT4311182.1 hypothetical protein [Anaerolineae bacterium]MBT4458403.1 hypothetical protein [Anaerolineae bacterium]MBT4843755.1 hypothetical protein [Anaerolineae bacterium]
MKKHRFFYILLITILSLSACTPAATPQPSSVETIVAATYAVAKAQTAAAMPTATLIPPTPTKPRITSTPFSTPTIFVVSSFTPSPTITATPAYTPTNITSGSGDILYACNIVKLSPESTYTVKPNEEFKWTWEVENIGTAKWWPDTAQVKYASGAEYYIKKHAAIDKPTDPGEIAIFKIKMRAPKETGTYTTTWSMRKGIHYFCYAQLKIVVKR